MVPYRALALAAALLLAGCIGAGDEPSLDDDTTGELTLARAVHALVGELPCEATVGEETSANLAELAADPLDEAGYGSAGELSLHEDLAFVARYGTGGFNIVDISDPLAPRELSAWDPHWSTRGLDVKATPDGTGALVAHDLGIALVDVRDPRAPVLEHVVEHEAEEVHMLSTFEIGQATYVAAPRADGKDLLVYRLDGEPGERTLELIATVALGPVTQATGVWSPEDITRTHDVFFYHDPLLERPTLWVANVWWGIVALDLSDPAAPEEILRVPNIKPQYTHTVQTVVVDDRRLTASVTELGVNTIKLFDTTDLDAPELLAEWSAASPHQPQHNLQLVPPYLYVAHYQEGVLVYALDALVAGNTAPIARLASSGAPIQSDSPPTQALVAAGLFRGTWDVNVKEGLLYVTDGALRVVAFGCVTPGDARVTSIG